jgi:hypothetical protein
VGGAALIPAFTFESPRHVTGSSSAITTAITPNCPRSVDDVVIVIRSCKKEIKLTEVGGCFYLHNHPEGGIVPCVSDGTGRSATRCQPFPPHNLKGGNVSGPIVAPVDLLEGRLQERRQIVAVPSLLVVIVHEVRRHAPDFEGQRRAQPHGDRMRAIGDVSAATGTAFRRRRRRRRRCRCRRTEHLRNEKQQ